MISEFNIKRDDHTLYSMFTTIQDAVLVISKTEAETRNIRKLAISTI